MLQFNLKNSLTQREKNWSEESVLFKKIGEQQVELDFLKDCQKKVGVLEKRKLVDPGHKKLSIMKQLKLLGVARSSYILQG